MWWQRRWSRWCSRCLQPGTRPAAPPAWIRSRRCAMSDQRPEGQGGADGTTAASAIGAEATAARPGAGNEAGEVLRLTDLRRDFRQGRRIVEVLRGVDLSVAKGEIVALVAPSGAGKSTLLQIAGLLDTATSGTVTIAGQDMSALDDRARTRARRDLLGFVYQFHHLLPEFTALENVAIPMRAANRLRAEAEERAAVLLDRMGLAERLDHRPAELSGGEQQRVAIARALANDPALLLADEPTGNLDPETSARVFDMLLKMVRETGLAALIATHNHALAERMDRIVRLEQGRVVGGERGG